MEYQTIVELLVGLTLFLTSLIGLYALRLGDRLRKLEESNERELMRQLAARQRALRRDVESHMYSQQGARRVVDFPVEEKDLPAFLKRQAD